jgi:hypothetical protein
VLFLCSGQQIQVLAANFVTPSVGVFASRGCVAENDSSLALPAIDLVKLPDLK